MTSDLIQATIKSFIFSILNGATKIFTHSCTVSLLTSVYVTERKKQLDIRCDDIDLSVYQWVLH